VLMAGRGLPNSLLLRQPLAANTNRDRKAPQRRIRRMNDVSLKSLKVGADARDIAVRQREGKGPGLFWLGGFKSDMKGTKAEALDLWAAKQGRACTRFDYSGHGESGGDFAEGTIGRWLEESVAVFNQFCRGPQIVIGSSMGGWMALLLARELNRLAKAGAPAASVAAMVLIAPAPDFTEALMWKRFTPEIKKQIEETGSWSRPSEYSQELYLITRGLIEDGRILKSQERAIWKIISILNLPAVLQGKVDLEKEGLPYNKITATILVQNGLFETENLIIDSPIVKITAAGSFDLPTDQVDMVWAVSPFGSYSQFLKTIPLFGRLFAGDRKGIATALFSVKGSIEDPDVTYLPMKSFATGVTGLAQLAFDILKNTLMLPIDLMTPDEVKEESKELTPAPEPVPSPP